MPIATDRLITLPPGRNWHSPNRSVNSAPDSQRCRSTMARRASGSAPPNDVSPRPRKPLNRSATLGTQCAAAASPSGNALAFFEAVDDTADFATAASVPGVSDAPGAEEEEC